MRHRNALKQNYHTMAIGWLLLFYFKPLKAQDAKSLFSDYMKIGLTTGWVNYHTKNPANSVDYRMSISSVYQLGLTWNFYQIQNHNLKASFIVPFSYTEKTSMRIKAHDFPRTTDFISLSESNGGGTQMKGNILYEHFFPLSPQIYLAAAGGLEMLHYPRKTSKTTSGGGTGPKDEEGIYAGIETNSQSTQDFSMGFKAEMSAYFATDIGLFQAKLEGLIGFNDYQETTATTYGLSVSPNTMTKHPIKGHYIGFGLSYFLKQGKKRK